MQAWQTGMTAVAVAVAMGSLAWLLWQRPRRDADLLFAVVSGSLALSLLAPWLTEAPVWMQWAVAIGGSATCNGYWLVSRALFRGEGGVTRVHVAIAAGVALLIAGYRGALLGTHDPAAPATLALEGLLTLASSSLLVLSFLEAARGWSLQWPAAERRLRLVFMAVFGACVLSTTLVSALATSLPALREARVGLVALCATAMIVFTLFAFRHRRRYPLGAARGDAGATATVAPAAEDLQLAEALRHLLEVRQVYREPELKVADLARRLGVAEHRLSRLIGQGLGEKNFNQLINRHRIAHACRLLAAPDQRASILDISADSGFASLGPFNRAFKAALGCTPSAYRAQSKGTGVAESPIAGDQALRAVPSTVTADSAALHPGYAKG